MIDKTEQHDLVVDAYENAVSVVDLLLSPGSPVAEELKSKEKFGGYVCIADDSGFPLLTGVCGMPSEAKRRDFLTFCQEKAGRLGEYTEHTLSLASRDPEQQRYGGAVRAEGFIVSFSGFPERLDEIVSAVVLWQMGGLDFEDIRTVLTENPYLDLFTDADLMRLDPEIK